MIICNNIIIKKTSTATLGRLDINFSIWMNGLLNPYLSSSLNLKEHSHMTNSCNSAGAVFNRQLSRQNTFQIAKETNAPSDPSTPLSTHMNGRNQTNQFGLLSMQQSVACCKTRALNTQTNITKMNRSARPPQVPSTPCR